jgi:hypothetical protein
LPGAPGVTLNGRVRIQAWIGLVAAQMAASRERGRSATGAGGKIVA